MIGTWQALIRALRKTARYHTRDVSVSAPKRLWLTAVPALTDVRFIGSSLGHGWARGLSQTEHIAPVCRLEQRPAHYPDTVSHERP